MAGRRKQNTVQESRIEATARLRHEGRWNEACEYREAERQRLRTSGVSRKDAVERSWAAMLAEFQPLEVPEPSISASPSDAVHNRDLDQKSLPDLAGDVLWVYENLERSKLEPCDAPSCGAWGLLLHARQYRQWFFSTMLPKALAVREQQDEGKRTETDGVDMLELLKAL